MLAYTLKEKFLNELCDVLSRNEILAIWNQWVVKEIIQISKIHYFLNQDLFLTDEQVFKITSLISHIISNKPVEYFFGYSYFRNLKLFVNSHVLIPRPETEELIDIILDNLNNISIKSVIDIGTGSGCIAISLKKYISANLFAFDYSDHILSIARKNAHKYNMSINFQKVDILNIQNYTSLPKVDVIVSNPPYVIHSEVNNNSVIHAEPISSIFVNKDNPLIFYEKILIFSKYNLNHNGRIFFEINPLFVLDLVSLIREYNYSDIQIHEDFYGKKRFIVVSS